MPWTDVTPLNAPADLEGPVRLALDAGHGRRPRQLVLSIEPEMLRLLGWRIGEAMRVQAGHGREARQLLISRDGDCVLAPGRLRAAAGTGFLRFRLPWEVEGLGRVAQPVRYMLEPERTLRVHLPHWALPQAIRTLEAA